MAQILSEILRKSNTLHIYYNDHLSDKQYILIILSAIFFPRLEFYFETWERKRCRSIVALTRLSRRPREGKKRKKKAKKKTAYLTGLRVGFGQSFPTVPTRRSSGGVDGESNSPVINTRVKSRLLIIFYFQCVWEVCRPAAGSLHEAASPIEATASTLFFSLLVFFIRDFFFFFYFHSARWAGSEEWRRRELECLCLLGDRLVNHMNITGLLVARASQRTKGEN